MGQFLKVINDVINLLLRGERQLQQILIRWSAHLSIEVFQKHRGLALWEFFLCVKDIPSAELDLGPLKKTFYEADTFPLS